MCWFYKFSTNLCSIFLLLGVFQGKNKKKCVFLWFIKDNVVDLGTFSNF